MTSAEASFRESLRAFNSGRPAGIDAGVNASSGSVASSFTSFFRPAPATAPAHATPAQASNRSFSSFFGGGGGGGGGSGGGVGNNSSSGDLEAQESLLGSFQARAQGALSSVGFGPRNADTEFCGLTTFQRYVGFFMVMGTAVLCFTISLFTLPMVLLAPSKFALTYTMGSLLFLFSFSLLNGLMAHAKHIFSWDRLPFTASYLGSMLLTLFFAVVKPSYILVIFFCIVQVVCLAWYLGSYLPGGTQGLRFMTRSIGLPV
ncbi:Got1/Sft2-like family-domain-containing protein [Entophlyctis helioformis]|nr:Got1/Sft2-like family-domain-containing protein [Entophlyctis helioformis]